jgi:hypothetical protein
LPTSTPAIGRRQRRNSVRSPTRTRSIRTSRTLNAQQLADIKAVEVPLVVVAAPGNNNIGTATWTYNIPDTAVDFLAAGETLTLTYMAEVDSNYP